MKEELETIFHDLSSIGAHGKSRYDKYKTDVLISRTYDIVRKSNDDRMTKYFQELKELDENKDDSVYYSRTNKLYGILELILENL